MTANPLAKINPTPFCDTSCKGIRVFGQFLGQSLHALGLLIASVVCSIFSSDLACIYFSMANAQFIQGSNAFVTYCEFGEQLIDFSYNGCVIAPSSETEESALRTRYGSSAIDQWLQIGTEEIPLRPEKLKRVEGGICVGMTLDFIKSYLQQIQAGLSPMEAIRKISSRYVTGAPEEAQLAQIFYRALDSTHLTEREWTRLDASLEKQKTDSFRWLDRELKEIFALPEEEIPERSIQLQTLCNERLNHFG